MQKIIAEQARERLFCILLTRNMLSLIVVVTLHAALESGRNRSCRVVVGKMWNSTVSFSDHYFFISFVKQS